MREASSWPVLVFYLGFVVEKRTAHVTKTLSCGHSKKRRDGPPCFARTRKGGGLHPFRAHRGSGGHGRAPPGRVATKRGRRGRRGRGAGALAPGAAERHGAVGGRDAAGGGPPPGGVGDGIGLKGGSSGATRSSVRT